MTVKIGDTLDDGWLCLVSQIRNGEHPKKEHLIAALRRQDPEIPGDAQLYIARLLNGEIDRRGRPEDTFGAAWKAGLLAWRIARWRRVYRCRDRPSVNSTEPLQRAIDKVASERGAKPASLLREYRRAIARLQRESKGYGEAAPWALGFLSWIEKLDKK